MNKKYIAVSLWYWGVGDTIEEANQNRKENGGKDDKTYLYEFESELPFAPFDRDANDDEADCYIDKMGAINWIRCKYHEVDFEGDPVSELSL